MKYSSDWKLSSQTIDVIILLKISWHMQAKNHKFQLHVKWRGAIGRYLLGIRIMWAETIELKIKNRSSVSMAWLWEFDFECYELNMGIIPMIYFVKTILHFFINPPTSINHLWLMRLVRSNTGKAVLGGYILYIIYYMYIKFMCIDIKE